MRCIISVHRVFLIVLLVLLVKLYGGAIQITYCIVLYCCMGLSVTAELLVVLSY